MFGQVLFGLLLVGHKLDGVGQVPVLDGISEEIIENLRIRQPRDEEVPDELLAEIVLLIACV